MSMSKRAATLNSKHPYHFRVVANLAESDENDANATTTEHPGDNKKFISLSIADNFLNDDMCLKINC